jgi:lysylphosphatidylglycerol synthetase-like protein (DUF2156 family)
MRQIEEAEDGWVSAIVRIFLCIVFPALAVVPSSQLEAKPHLAWPIFANSYFTFGIGVVCGLTLLALSRRCSLWLSAVALALLGFGALGLVLVMAKQLQVEVSTVALAGGVGVGLGWHHGRVPKDRLPSAESSDCDNLTSS